MFRKIKKGFTNLHKKPPMLASLSLGRSGEDRKAGFTLIEVLTIAGIAVIMGSMILLNLYSERSNKELDAASQKIGTLLREANSKARSGKDNSSWGVHFEASSSDVFFALSPYPYAPNSEEGHYNLSNYLRYDTSSWSGNTKDIIFNPINGKTTSASIRIYVYSNQGQSSSIAVASSGAVSY